MVTCSLIDRHKHSIIRRKRMFLPVQYFISLFTRANLHELSVFIFSLSCHLLSHVLSGKHLSLSFRSAHVTLCEVFVRAQAIQAS